MEQSTNPSGRLSGFVGHIVGTHPIMTKGKVQKPIELARLLRNLADVIDKEDYWEIEWESAYDQDVEVMNVWFKLPHGFMVERLNTDWTTTGEKEEWWNETHGQDKLEH